MLVVCWPTGTPERLKQQGFSPERIDLEAGLCLLPVSETHVKRFSTVADFAQCLERYCLKVQGLTGSASTFVRGYIATKSLLT